MKTWLMSALAAIILVGAGMPAGIPPAQASTEMSGQVVAEIDPFLVLRNVARYDEEAFQTLFNLALDQALTPDQKDVLLFLLQLNGVPLDDPEALIDFLESKPLGFDFKALLAEFLVVDTETILALVDLPPELQSLLTGLLPETLDLNFLPLAGARLSALSSRGAVLRWATSSLDGSYSLTLPTNAVSLRVTRTGYQPLLLDLEGLAPADLMALSSPELPGMLVMTPNPGRLTAIVVQGSRNLPVRNALVSVPTANGGPALPTSLLGLATINGVEPLLPGLFGGLSFHKVLVDAEDYYLEEQRVLFLTSAALARFNLTKAPPFGTLMGKATVRRLLGESNFAGVSIDVLDVTDTPIGTALSAANGEYEIRDTVPKGTWTVRFTNPQATAGIRAPDVQIRAARETEANVCFSSLNGTYGVPIFGTNGVRSIRVIDADENIVGSATSPGSTRFYTYEILGIPPGTYRVEFRVPASNTNPSISLPNYVIGDCAVRTEVR